MVVPGIRMAEIRSQDVGAWCLLFCILLSGPCFLSPANAKDCRTLGMIYPIDEEDPVQVIQKKLQTLEESGELEQRNKELQQKTKASIERPTPVEGITKASESRIFYYDPTYVVQQDLTDHKGQVFARKGTKINPLDTVAFSQTLMFFDGDDETQVTWIKKQIHTDKTKLILIKGAPLALSQELKVPVYFDQGGYLTKKLGITHVPSVVAQEKSRLRIEEISMKEAQ